MLSKPQVESTTSYLKRLARRHHLSVADLIAFCCEKALGNSLLTSWTQTQAMFQIDGATPIGEMWSRLLVDLTCCDEVRYLKSIINSRRLLRKRQGYSNWLSTNVPLQLRRNHKAALVQYGREPERVRKLRNRNLPIVACRRLNRTAIPPIRVVQVDVVSVIASHDDEMSPSIGFVFASNQRPIGDEGKGRATR